MPTCSHWRAHIHLALRASVTHCRRTDILRTSSYGVGGFQFQLNKIIMCIYENKIKNLKYQPNKKNKGCAPAIKDLRLSTVATACGWCKECRKALANHWKIRLTEELKDNRNAVFANLSLSPEGIKKIESEILLKKWQGIENEDGEVAIDVNKVAAYAVRMWTERWRKKHKKAPKHWLITELGENETERIHLHGLIWGNQQDIEKTWQYGNTKFGTYVNSKTINYILKYVTKIDKKHNGYKQKILTSQGIGKGYLNRCGDIHKFRKEDTITYYRTKEGYKLGLPRYYKEKLWTEEEREKIWQINLDKNEIYLDGEKIDKTNISLEQWNNKLENVREKEKRSGYGNSESGNKTYIVTQAMRLKKNEWSEKDKQKYMYQRREITKILNNDESNEISKNNQNKRVIYGKYTGTTTEAQRNYNELLEEANSKQISVRVLRLIKEGIIVDNFVNK